MAALLAAGVLLSMVLTGCGTPAEATGAPRTPSSARPTEPSSVLPFSALPSDDPSLPLSSAAPFGVSADAPAAKTDGGGTEEIAAEAQEQVQLPVLMYHGVLRSRKGAYVVSPAQLEADLAALRRAGYTPVRAEQVIAYADGRGSLPTKPVLLTFDDGHYNSWYYAAPLLRKYNASAVFNVVGKYTDFSTGGERDNPNYSYLTWDEIAAMAESREAEIGNHTYAMHEMRPRFGAGRMEGESDEAYAAALREDIGKLQTSLCERSGIRPVIFAYPFGKYSCVSQEVLCDMGFRMILTCNEMVSTVRRGDPSSILCLGRFNRNGKVSTAHMMREITGGRYLPPGE